jgi:hypothetical protein
MTLNQPTDDPVTCTHTLNTLKYKIGKFGIVFVWIDNAWIRSTKTADELDGKSNSRFRKMSK